MVFGRGEIDYSYGEDGGTEGTDILLHIARGGLGFDLQFDGGLRARLGIVARWPIYTQARIEGGGYDASIRQETEDWFRNRRTIGPELSVGWAF